MITRAALTVTALVAAPARLAADGFAVITRLLSPAGVATIRTAVERLPRASEAPRRRGGVRGVLNRSPDVSATLEAEGVSALVRRLLGDRSQAVRSILFDKTPAANWLVPWHQDTTIAVAERIDAPGFGPWSIKNGVLHVQPPPPVLWAMLTVRINLDDCGPDNGPLTVLPGAHRHGVLAETELAKLVASGEPAACIGRAGDGLLMRPLLPHCSAKARRPRRRRVLHIEYAAAPLPDGMRWTAN